MHEAHPGEGRSAGNGGDRGDTLIELIIAMVIIALAVVPFVGTLIETLSGSGEHRTLSTLNTALKDFAETAKSQIEFTNVGSQFNNCAGTVNYKLLSAPVPQAAAPGAAVTVFGTGFASGLPVSAFTVTVGGKAARVTTKRSQGVSGTEMGNMQLTFFVPGGLAGQQKITVTDSGGDRLTSTGATALTVTATATKSTVSPLSGYTMGITRVRYWNPGKRTETKTLANCVLNGGVQLLTLQGRSHNGVRDTLTFSLRDPTPVHVPLPTPSVTVTASPVLATLPPHGGRSPLVFTAIVTAASGSNPPSKPVTWAVKAAGSPLSCTTTGPVSIGGNAARYTCTITLTTSSATGSYQAKATYPAVAPTPQSKTPGNNSASWIGFATVYAANGSGTAAVAPATGKASKPGQTFVFSYTAGAGGMNSGEVTVSLPASSTPKKTWTVPTPSSGHAGYTTAKVGTTSQTVIVTGTTIEVTGLTLSAGQTLTITYGQGGGATGVTAPATTGVYTFTVSEASVPGGPLTPLTSGSPKVTVK